MNKPVLLIVDDDPQVLAAVRRDLRSRYREHYTVLSAASGEEALATVRELKTRGRSRFERAKSARLRASVRAQAEFRAWYSSSQIRKTMSRFLGFRTFFGMVWPGIERLWTKLPP